MEGVVNDPHNGSIIAKPAGPTEGSNLGEPVTEMAGRGGNEVAEPSLAVIASGVALAILIAAIIWLNWWYRRRRKTHPYETDRDLDLDVW